MGAIRADRQHAVLFAFAAFGHFVLAEILTLSDFAFAVALLRRIALFTTLFDLGIAFARRRRCRSSSCSAPS